jgi:lipopolysaccharide/colanic/teichoic acid biosynthesis glycosyltransferase
MTRMSSAGYRGKRLLDLLVASTAIVILSPVMMAIAVLVRLLLGKPVLFRQQRPGLRGVPFIFLKFRTMTEACDPAGNLRPDGERLTCLGGFLES